MQNLLLGISIGILVIALLDYIFDDTTKKDMENRIMWALSWCIVWTVIQAGLLTALGGLIAAIVNTFVINPLFKKAIENRYNDEVEEDD